MQERGERKKLFHPGIKPARRSKAFKKSEAERKKELCIAAKNSRFIKGACQEENDG